MAAPEGNRRAWGIAYHKFVHFFLLQYAGGDVADHDLEVNEARWVPLSEAKSLLAFANERSVLAEAAELLGNG